MQVHSLFFHSLNETLLHKGFNQMLERLQSDWITWNVINLCETEEEEEGGPPTLQPNKEGKRLILATIFISLCACSYEASQHFDTVRTQDRTASG